MLFDVYSKNAELFDEKYKGLFVCPLCLRAFNQQGLGGLIAGNKVQPFLALAHLFPEALGGKLTTLSCRDCECGMGTKYEKQLVEHFAAMECVEGSGKRRARIETPVGPLAATFEWKDGKFEINAHYKNNNPVTMRQALGQTFKDGKGTITIEGANWKFARLGFLHGAYLAMFKMYGYEYLATQAAMALRKLLIDDPTATTAPYRFVYVESWNGTSSIRHESVGTVRVNGTLLCNAAVFKAPTKRHFATVIMLPGFGPEHERRFEEQLLEDKETQFDYTPIPWDKANEWLKDPDFFGSGHHFWKGASEDESPFPNPAERGDG